MVEFPLLSVLHMYIRAQQAIFDRMDILDLVIEEQEAPSSIQRSRMAFSSIHKELFGVFWGKCIYIVGDIQTKILVALPYY